MARKSVNIIQPQIPKELFMETKINITPSQAVFQSGEPEEPTKQTEKKWFYEKCP